MFETVTIKLVDIPREPSETLIVIVYVPTYAGLVGLALMTNGLAIVNIPPGILVAAPPLN